jgi:hypothetical protein
MYRQLEPIGPELCSSVHYMHLYIVVNCETQNCQAVHVLMHLGEKGKTPARVEYWMAYPLMIDCPSCGKTYDYSNVEENFQQKELPAPSPEYLDRLAPPSIQNAFPALPRGFMRIRNFGFLASRRRAELLPLCLRLLQPSDQPAVSATSLTTLARWTALPADS